MLRYLLSLFATLGFAACVDDSASDPPAVGANYLDPAPNSCTEFSLSDIFDGQKTVREYYQVFFRKQNDSVVSIDEFVYGPKLRGEDFIGSRSMSININRDTGREDSLEIGSDLYFTYQDKYRDLDEVRESATENVKLTDLLPETNARKIGYVAPFQYGAFSLDTAYIIINGDLDDQEWAYTMIFRKNGELILSYRFQLSGPAKGQVAWIAEETRTRCGSILIRPD